MFRIAIIVLGTLLLPSTVSADIKKADQAMGEKDFATAFAEYLIEAENGSARAQYQLARLYIAGTGTEKNINEAERWLLKAEEAGDITATFILGQFYLDGLSGEPDLIKANKYLERAAEGNFLNAFYLLAGMALKDGPDQDLVVGRKWLERIVETDIDRGDRIGLIKVMLARMYLKGQGGPKNYEKSIMLYRELGMIPNYSAQTILADVYLDEENPYRDEAEALTWYYLTQMNGYDKNSPEVVEFERNASRDLTIPAMNQAAAHFRQSAKMAKFNTGPEEGTSLVTYASQHILDYKNAVIWLADAAQKGSSYSVAALFDAYYAGEVVEQNMEKALYFSTLSRVVAPKVPILRSINLGSMTEARHDEITDAATRWGSENLELFPDERLSTDDVIRKRYEMSKLMDAVVIQDRQRSSRKTDNWNFSNRGENFFFPTKNAKNEAESSTPPPARAPVEVDPRPNSEAELIYQSGLKYLTMQNYQQAAEKLHAALALGYKKAGLALGQIYSNERNAIVDMKRAVAYLEIAALDEGGGETAAEAANFLAQIYRGNSPAIETGEKTAYKWLEVAAENSHPAAAAEVGLDYYNGTRVEKDPAKAFRLVRTAAVRGHAIAQFNLGLFYYQGTGTRADPVKALAWFMTARDTDPATDNGTIAQFQAAMTPSKNKAATDEYNRLRLSFSR